MTVPEPLINEMETALEAHKGEYEPDHTQLPESDGSFVKNFQEHPQSLILTSSIEPVLQQLHPDGQYCIGQDSGIYWRRLDPSEDPLKGCEAPDWFYVPNVPPFLRGEHRRSYVMWIEKVAPLIAIEFVSGNGEEERDKTPWETIDPKTNKMRKSGKFWVYEQGIQIPFYGIYEVQKASVEVYRLVSGQYEKMEANHRNHYEIEPMGVELGIRYGSEEPPVPWLRWWDKEGNLLLTGSERAAQAEILAERERLIASQERLARQEAETIAAQERLAKQEAEAIAAQERLAKQEAEAIAAQERQQKEQERLAKQQAEAIAAQERLAKQEAEAIAAQERQQKEQERLAKQQAEAIAAQERLAKQEAEATVQAEREKNEKLVAYLRSIGVNPEAI